MRNSLVVLATGLLLSGCGDDPGSGVVVAPDSCSVEARKQFVWEVLKDTYLWAEQLPESIDFDDFSDEEALLKALRYQPADRFSFITTQADEDARQSNRMTGLGVSLLLNQASDAYIVRYAYKNSPAWDAGLRRGDRIIAFDGEPVEQLVAAMDAGQLTWDEIIKPATAGVSLSISWLDAEGNRFSDEVIKARITTNRVHGERIFNTAAGRIGYFAFTSFTEASGLELQEVFSLFQADNLDELILDLRYNGGGRISVAQQLASSITGALTADEVFVEYLHNDTYTSRNSTSRFINPPEALDLPSVTVLTSAESCSASELVINSLQPFVDVTVVGEVTCGKPVGMYLHEYCDKVLYPIEFQLVNADAEGDYFDGLTPDCVVPDMPRYPWGDVRDTQLAAALDYIETGSCPVASGKPIGRNLSTQTAIYPDWDI